MRPLLAAILFSSSLGAAAQNTNTVCGIQEFCFCWDDPGLVSFTFLPCPDSVVTDVHLLFCVGQMALVDTPVIRGFNGVDNTAEPMLALTGLYLNLSNVSGTGSTAIHLEVEFPDTVQLVCQAGDTPPWRWLVWTGYPATWPVVGDCASTAPYCLTTGMAAHHPTPNITVRDRELLLPTWLSSAARIDLFDTSGRSVGSILAQGRTTIALPVSLGPGIYVAVLENGGVRSSTRFVLGEQR
ncbi:MAG: T9SS type A sorting domain-containing protein [Flavobacteriales bacterium]|nr:T9SS type A sorting domain-containing protein [Flavobacteriales bacterium]